MRLLCLVTFLCFLTLPARTEEKALQTERQKILYSVGVSLAEYVEPLGTTAAELPFVWMGLEDAVRGRRPKVDLATYQPKIKELAQKREATQIEKEKQKGRAYAAKAVKEKGAIQTASGLVLIPIKEGKGAPPKVSDQVAVHYHGTLVDGTVFDSSLKYGSPAVFPLNGLIPCWTEGIQKIKVGGKVRLVCPSEIAYGDDGSPPKIPGGATLVFEVELLDIVKR